LRMVGLRNKKSLALAAVIIAACVAAAVVDSRMGVTSDAHWWKGNLHTHSLWSDGDDFPDMIAQWYKDHDYQFLGISDHNVLAEGDRWMDVDTPRLKTNSKALREYIYRMGESWIEQRTVDGKQQVRLKPLSDYRKRFEEPGKFLLLQNEEITDKFEKLPIHLCATNVKELIQPKGGNSVREVMQNDVDAVHEQRRRTNQPMFPHLNHPNFGWALTAEDIADVKGERFFEVYNGHPTVYNNGDELRAGMDKIWDVALTRRISKALESKTTPEPLYGLGVDDAHNYHTFDGKKSIAGRGWVMVNAPELTPTALITAMEAGDFYAATGVRLKSVVRAKDRLSVEIDAERGVQYTIRFYGTRKGYDPKSYGVLSGSGQPLVTTRRYSADIGAVLSEKRGKSATYHLKGDELYVRAKIISTKTKWLGLNASDTELAWTQPVIPSLMDEK
jgi:hypothetical protein